MLMQVFVRLFYSEIVPRKKAVKCIEIIPLRHKPFSKDLFHMPFAITCYEPVYIRNIKIDKSFFYKHIIADVLLTDILIRPETILLLQTSEDTIPNLLL